MGAFLDKPNVEKTTTAETNGDLLAGVSAMQGASAENGGALRLSRSASCSLTAHALPAPFRARRLARGHGGALWRLPALSCALRRLRCLAPPPARSVCNALAPCWLRGLFPPLSLPTGRAHGRAGAAGRRRRVLFRRVRRARRLAGFVAGVAAGAFPPAMFWGVRPVPPSGRRGGSAAVFAARQRGPRRARGRLPPTSSACASPRFFSAGAEEGAGGARVGDRAALARGHWRGHAPRVSRN